jgi:hypothetical protein
MREGEGVIEEGEGQVEVRDFSKTKEEMVGFLQHELRRAKNFGVFDEQSREIKQQRVDYLGGIINSLENGQLSLAREYFAGLMEEKEQIAAQMAGDLQKAIVAAKPKVDKLNQESARLLGELEKVKQEGNWKRAQGILKEIGNVDDAIGGVVVDQEEKRQNLRRAQDDPDLDKFTKFVAAIDAELEKGIRKI